GGALQRCAGARGNTMSEMPTRRQVRTAHERRARLIAQMHRQLSTGLHSRPFGNVLLRSQCAESIVRWPFPLLDDGVIGSTHADRLFRPEAIRRLLETRASRYCGRVVVQQYRSISV